MRRLLSRAVTTGVCTVVAGVLAVGPAQAASSATSPVAAQHVTLGALQPASSSLTGIGSERQERDGEYREQLGRVRAPWNDELTCSGDIFNPECEWESHYTYVDLVAPADIGQELWNRLLQFGQCVVGTAGLATVTASIATGGVSLAIVVTSLSFASDVCGSVTLEEMALATVDIYDGT